MFSILILLEVILWKFVNDRILLQNTVQVSILILLEVTLEVLKVTQLETTWIIVSILILLEVTLEDE